MHNWLKLVWQVAFMRETQLLVSKTAGTTGVEGDTTEGTTVAPFEGTVMLVEGTVVLVLGVTVVLVVGVTVLVLAAGVTVVSNILEAFPRLA